jgi:hypothetical protein
VIGSDIVQGSPPPKRFRHGFTGANGNLFVFSGAYFTETLKSGDLNAMLSVIRISILTLHCQYNSMICISSIQTRLNGFKFFQLMFWALHPLQESLLDLDLRTVNCLFMVERAHQVCSDKIYSFK